MTTVLKTRGGLQNSAFILQPWGYKGAPTLFWNGHMKALAMTGDRAVEKAIKKENFTFLLAYLGVELNKPKPTPAPVDLAIVKELECLA